MYRKMEINEGLARWRKVPLAHLVDVRDPDEYRRHRVPGSRNCPLSEILEKGDSFIADKDSSIYVFSGTGRRSKMAAEYLSGLGFRVIDLGGLIHYRGPFR